MLDDGQIHKIFSTLDKELVEEIISVSKLKTFPANTEIISEGQYIKTIPLVVDGLVKVYISNEDKEFVLYHLKATESCATILTASLNCEHSKVFALTEKESNILFMPANHVARWLEENIEFNKLFFQQYNRRYSDMLDTIYNLIFNKVEDRLYKYLQEKVCATDINPLKLSHKQIAIEMGTAREVVSRSIKRLEEDGKVQQSSCSIQVL